MSLQESQAKTMVELPRITIMDIIRYVCGQEDILLNDLLSSRRQKRTVEVRDIARYLACILTTASLLTIGRAFHNDHTSILYARQKLEKNRLTDKALDGKLTLYEKELKEMYWTEP